MVTTRGAANNAGELLPLGTVARFEFRFILLVALFLCVVSSIPYLIAQYAPIPGSTFTNILAYETDANNYLAYAHQSAAGAWLFHNPMTGEPHGNVFLNFEWLLMGKIAALFHLSLGAAMNCMRLLFIPILCFGAYWLSTFLIHDIFLRRSVLVATTTGGGFGWMVFVVHRLHIPVEESYFFDLKSGLFPFYWSLELPHFLIAGAFATLTICFFLHAERQDRLSSYLVAGLFFLLTGACRPYDMLYLIVATSLYLCLSFWIYNASLRTSILRIVPMLMCFPLLGYYCWIFRIHPVFRWWSLPGKPPPSPWALALSFGMAFPLLFFSAWKLYGQRIAEAGTFVICCLVSAIVLVYPHHLLHFSFQFATDIAVPLLMVGFLGLEKPFARWNLKGGRARLSLIALLAINSFTSIALTAQAARMAWRASYRLDNSLVEAYQWLDGHSRPDELVLADFENSNRVPQYTHNRVFCGYSNTVRFSDKQEAVDLFLATGTSNEFRTNLLQQNSIRYILLTQEEARLPMLRDVQSLHRVFANTAAVIYSVDR